MGSATIQRAFAGIRGGLSIRVTTLLRNAMLTLTAANQLTDEQLARLGFSPDDIIQVRKARL